MLLTSLQTGKAHLPDIHLSPETTPFIIIGENFNNYRKRGDLQRISLTPINGVSTFTKYCSA
jgi:hypothetical protein